MVGVKKYEDEQIHFILHAQKIGHIASEIVKLCQQRWPRKEFKVSGIKYVLQSYGKDPVYKPADTSVHQMQGFGMLDQYGMPIQYSMQYAHGNNVPGNHGFGMYPVPMGASGFQYHGQGHPSLGGQIYFHNPVPGNQYGQMMQGVPNAHVAPNSQIAPNGQIPPHGQVSSMSQSPQQAGRQMSPPSLEDELRQVLARELNSSNSGAAAGFQTQNQMGSSAGYSGQAPNYPSPAFAEYPMQQAYMNSGGYQHNTGQAEPNAGQAQASTDSPATNATSEAAGEAPADPLLDPILFANQNERATQAAADNASGGAYAPGSASGNYQSLQLPYQFEEPVITNLNDGIAMGFRGTPLCFQGAQGNQNEVLQRPYQFSEPVVNNVKKATVNNRGKNNNARARVPPQFNDLSAVEPSAAEKVYEESYPEYPFGRPKTSLSETGSPATEPEKVYGGYPKHPFGTPKIAQQPTVAITSSSTVEPDKEYHGYPEFPLGRPASQLPDKITEPSVAGIPAQSTRSNYTDAFTQSDPEAAVLDNAVPNVLSVGSENIEFPALPTVMSFLSPVFEQPFIMPPFGSGWTIRAGTADDIKIDLENPEDIPCYILQSPGALINLFNPIFKGGFFCSDYQPVPQQAEALQNVVHNGTVSLGDIELNSGSLFVSETPSPDVGLDFDEMPNAMSAAIQDLAFDDLVASIEQSPEPMELSAVSENDLHAVMAIKAAFELQQKKEKEVDDYFSYNLSLDQGVILPDDMQATGWPSSSTSMAAINAVEVATPSPPVVVASRKRGSEVVQNESPNKRQATNTTLSNEDEQKGKEKKAVPSSDSFEAYLDGLLADDARQDEERRRRWENQGDEFDFNGYPLPEFPGEFP